MISLEYVDEFIPFYKENKDMVDAHYDGFLGSTGEIHSPSFPLFQKLIDIGAMALFKVIEEDMCVGYISLSISPSATHEGQINFLLDHIFIEKSHRGKGYFEEALTLLEKDLIAEGVEKYSMAFPSTRGHDALATKLGFKKTTVLYTKSLGDN